MRVLVTGATGQVGSEIVRELGARASGRKRDRIEILAPAHASLDFSSRDQSISAICAYEPDLVLHAGAWTAVDACEADPDRAFAVNSLGTRHVAEGARLVGAHVVYLSTDYVFDGRLDRAYDEWDATNPLSVYGRSKLGGEQAIDPGWTTIRTSWVMGRGGANMAKTVLGLARGGDGPLRFVDDQRGSPTLASDLASKMIDLGLGRRAGLFHVTNQGSTSWFGFAGEVLAAAGFDRSRVEPIAASDLDPPRAAPRPENSVLDNAALRLSGDGLLPDWRDAVARLVPELT